MKFTIGEEQVKQRKRNLVIGAFFAVCLVLLTIFLNRFDPRSYNDVLMWSIVGFVGLFSVVHLYRHSRYLRLVKEHWLEVGEGKLQFHTNDSDSELNLKEEVAAIRFFRKKGNFGHIQILLRNNRGIRLESYGDMEGLAKALSEQVPKEIITD